MYTAFSLPLDGAHTAYPASRSLPCLTCWFLPPIPVLSPWPPFCQWKYPPGRNTISFPRENRSVNGSPPMDTSLTDILLPIQKHVASLVTDQRQLHNLSTYLFTLFKMHSSGPVEPESRALDQSRALMFSKPRVFNALSHYSTFPHNNITGWASLFPSSGNDNDTAMGDSLALCKPPQRWDRTFITHGFFLLILCKTVFLPSSFTN